MPRRHDNPLPRPGRRRPTRAFTLVELMIVIVILAILATMVVPRFTSASASAKQATLKDDLRYMRTQVLLYKAQHGDTPPGYPGGNPSSTPDESSFTAQMTTFSDSASATNPTRTPVYKLGPYVLKLPKNPINGKGTVLVIGNGGTRPAASDAYGWVYKPQTQEFWSDSTGVDDSGKPFADY